jgi:hypothetical protein
MWGFGICGMVVALWARTVLMRWPIVMMVVRS